MNKILIGSLLVAEALMLSKGGLQAGLHGLAGLPSQFSFAGLGQPQAVDRKWAAAMARKVVADAQADAQRQRHRNEVEACIGPSGPSMSPSRYDAKERACETRIAARAAAAATEAANATPAPTYRIGPPLPVAQASENETPDTGS
ncbi:MAG TPA: hypothetical protein VL460_11065 [Caulobacteraceae bacterium]|jgi:hypothetical protein|nr:hypothetical protein [Caulobacteraceae bacterium]